MIEIMPSRTSCAASELQNVLCHRNERPHFPLTPTLLAISALSATSKCPFRDTDNLTTLKNLENFIIMLIL